MVMIKSLKLKGFKSFANPTEIPFGPTYNCIIGVNGGGKCLIYDEIVQLANGSLRKIGEIVEEKFKSNKIKKIDDGYIIDGDDTKILSLDLKNLKIKPKKIYKYVKRNSPEYLIKIRTRSGREIKATEYHPLFIFKDGEIQSARADELKKGVKIAVAREIPTKLETKYFYELIDLIGKEDKIYVPWKKEFSDILRNLKKTTWKNLASEIGIPKNVIKGLLDKQSINFFYLVRILRKAEFSNYQIINLVDEIKSKNGNKKYKLPWKNSKSFARLFGYLLAEGRLPPTSNQVWFTNGTEEIVSDYVKLIKEVFGISPTVNEYKFNCWDVLAYSSVIRKILTKFGMPIGKTGDKEITNLFLSHADKGELCELLNGLYCGDGYVSKKSIEITTKSKKLGFAIENILSRLGLTYRSSYVVKIATNTGFSGVYKTIVMYGVENFIKFYNNIYLIHDKKRGRLEKLLNLKCNPNLDLINVNYLIKNISNELGLNIKKLKKKFPRLGSYCYNQCTPSVNGVRYLINNLFEPVSVSNSCLSLIKLKTIANSDIYWDEIISLEKIKSNEKWVYDLSIEEDHNFIANNIIVHNSNIMDALCFVLGKRSAKSMRAEKSANLIFNGGKRGSAMSKAEVSIVFDNSDKDFKIDSKDVKLTRIVKQNGQSKYLINDEKRTREQVIELLAHANIDPDGHNVILQGDIVRFMDQRPEDRRELLEEVAGISVYEDRKVKAMNELGRVGERLKEARLILTEREAYLRELKKERDQALKFKDCESKIKENKATYLHLQIKSKNESKEKVESSISKSNKEIESLNKKINELKERIDKNKNTVEELSKDIEEKSEKEQINLQRSIDSLKEEIIRDGARMETVESEIVKIHSRKKQLLLDLDELDDKVNNLIGNKNKLIRENEINIKKEKELLKKISVSKKGYSLDEIKKIDKLENEIENSQQKILSLQERKQFLLRDKDKFKFELEKINSVFDLLGKKKIKDKADDLKKIEKELNDLYSKDVVYGNRLSKLRTNFSVKNQELMKLKVKQETSKEYSFGNLAVKKVLGMKGVYGTISSLGNVDERYSNALEVVAGGRLNAVVVKDDKTAVSCIKELKKNRVGRAIFLPLNKISKRSISGLRELKNKKGVIGSALELINYDKKFENAFAHVFGSSLIVENVDVARKVGVGRARMITLGGDLFESTGVISGGYRRKSFGKFLEKNLEENIFKLGNEIKLIKNDLENLEKERKINESDLFKLKENKFVLEGELIKFESSSGVKDIKKLRSNKDGFENKLKQIDLELKDFDSQIKNFNNSINNLRDDKNKLRGKKIDDNKVQEVGELESKKDKLREDIVRNGSEVKNIDNQIKGIHDPEREKINKIIKDHEKEIKDFESELLNLRNELKNKNKELNVRKSKESKFAKEYKNLFNKRNKLNEDVNKYESRISSEEFKIKEIEKRINDYSIRKAKVISELEALNEEYEEFKGVKLRRNINLEDLRAEIKRFEHMMKNMGNVNLRALEIYENVEKEYKNLVEKADKLKEEKEAVLGMMHEIEKNKHGAFMKTFKIIAQNFKEIFLSLSTKGEAIMDLEDKENPFNAGIDIKVKLIGKKYLDIRSLSGGEKTLAALAFIFAIQDFNPANFYLLDEVDAALDKTNSELLSRLVAKYSKKAQYIMISHNDQMITEADKIYGVSMQENGISKLISLEF